MKDRVLRVFTVLIVLLTLGGNLCFAQDGKKTNLEILEQNISAELDKFFFYPDINRNLQFVFFVESGKKDKSEKRFIESVIKKSADKNKIRLSFSKDDQMSSADSVYYKAKINIEKLNTLYPRFSGNTFLGEKTLVREISSGLKVEIKLNDGAIAVSDNINTVFKGDIPYDDYLQYESEEYRFTQSSPPNISFIESIIFPAAIVAVSIAATVLFFTVRSK